MAIQKLGGASSAAGGDESSRSASGYAKAGVLLVAVALCVVAMQYGGSTRTSSKPSPAVMLPTADLQPTSLESTTFVAHTTVTPSHAATGSTAPADWPTKEPRASAGEPPAPTEWGAVEDAAYRPVPAVDDVIPLGGGAPASTVTTPAGSVQPGSVDAKGPTADDWMEPEQRSTKLVVQRGHSSGWASGPSTPEGPSATPEFRSDPDLTLPPVDWGPLSGLLQEMPACNLPTPCGANNCGVHHLNPCFDGCACPAPQCIVVNASACVTSPFWLPPAKALSRRRLPIEDGRCLDDRRRGLQEADDAPGDGASPGGGGDDSLFAPNVDVDGLKTTMKLFPHRNMAALADAACEHRANELGLQSTLFVNASGALEFENVCVRPRGRLASIGTGMWNAPSIGLEYGGFDKLRQLRSWMVPSSQDSRLPRRCVLDLPLFIFPVAHPADNHMHVFHRYAAAVSFLEERLGPDFRKRVLVLYVVLGEAEKRIKTMNAHRTFYHALSESWVAVRHGAAVDDPAPFACFNRAFMLSLSSDRGRARGRQSRGGPHSSENPRAPVGYPSNFRDTAVAFPLFGPREKRLQRGAGAVLRNLRRCFGGDARAGPRKEKPRLIVAWRSVSRRMVGFAGLAPQIALHWASIGGGDMRIMEHVRHDPVTLVQAHSAADVVVGYIGTALMWASLLPPDGVIVELGRSFGCIEERNASGWNVSGVCEYGGNAQVFGQQHLTVLLPKRSGDRKRGHGQRWEYVSLQVWKRLLDAAMCRLARPLVEGADDDPCSLGPLRAALGNALDDPLSAPHRVALSGT